MALRLSSGSMKKRAKSFLRIKFIRKTNIKINHRFNSLNYRFLLCFGGKRIVCMHGRTPPWAIVTEANSLLNSSSPCIAKVKCLGMILLFLLSTAALPANSRTSATRYSITEARYTEVPEAMRSAKFPLRNIRWILPTGKLRPARCERVLYFPWWGIPPVCVYFSRCWDCWLFQF